MGAGLDGNVDIGLDLDTKPATKALDNFKRKMRGTFGGQDAKALDQNIKQTEKTIKSLEKEIDKTKGKLKELSESDTPPKSVTAMERELEKAEKELQKLGKEFDKFSKEQGEIEARQLPMPHPQTGEMFSPEDSARIKELEPEFIRIGTKSDELTAKIEQLRAKLAEVKGNPQATDEAKKLNRELDEATEELEKQKQQYKDLTDEQRGMTKVAIPGLNTVEKTLKRIGGLIKRVFVFTVITKGLRALREVLSGVVSQNKDLTSSMNQIKGNLLTAVAPLYNTLIPAFQAVLNVIKLATQYLAQFIALLTGTSIDANKKAAKALYNQAEAAKAAGSANKKAAKDADKSALSFDELNTISSPKEDTGGGGGTSASPFQTSDLTLTDEIEKKLQAILVLVESIGGALLAWKIVGFIKDLIAGEKALKLLSSGATFTEAELKKLNGQASRATNIKNMFKQAAGIIMIVAGAILLVKNYCDAWVNGIDWGNFLGIITGLALVVGGLVLVLGASVAPFALIGAGIAALVLGIKDFITNGPTFQNILMVIIGLAAIFAATWMWASAPIALIVVAIVALIAAFVMLWNKCSGFREFWIGLWEKIKTTATDLWENTLKPLWEEHLKPALEAVWQKIQELWEQVIKPIINGIGTIINWLWSNILKPVIDWVVSVFVKQFQNAWENIKQAIDIAAKFISGIIDSLKDIFTGIIDFIVGVFTGDWKKAWEGLKTVFKGIINGIITIFEGMINFVINGINKFIGGLDAVVSKVGEIFGADWSVATIPPVELPRLAKGTVLPGGKPFAAIVNDQPAGHTNIEAPLDTIVEAMMIALSKGDFGNSGDININFTGNLAQLARILNPVIEREKKRTGPKLVKGGAY